MIFFLLTTVISNCTFSFCSLFSLLIYHVYLMTGTLAIFLFLLQLFRPKKLQVDIKVKFKFTADNVDITLPKSILENTVGLLIVYYSKFFPKIYKLTWLKNYRSGIRPHLRIIFSLYTFFFCSSWKETIYFDGLSTYKSNYMQPLKIYPEMIIPSSLMLITPYLTLITLYQR